MAPAPLEHSPPQTLRLPVFAILHRWQKARHLVLIQDTARLPVSRRQIACDLVEHCCESDVSFFTFGCWGAESLKLLIIERVTHRGNAWLLTADDRDFLPLNLHLADSFLFTAESSSNMRQHRDQMRFIISTCEQ